MNPEQLYNDLENKYADSLNQQNKLLEEQSKIQTDQVDANTNQVVNRINQNKDYAEQDYQKQARGAYQDYQKLINPYGIQAENAYAQGLGKAGYAETSKLNAYNTYQNRYASARSDAERAKTEFDNEIAEALLSGNKDKAQIALNKLQQQMTNMWNNLGLQTDLTNSRVSSNQWLQQFEYQKEQDKLANALAREQFEYQKEQDKLANAYRGSSSGYGYDDEYNFDVGDIYSADNVPDNTEEIQNAITNVASNALKTAKVDNRYTPNISNWEKSIYGVYNALTGGIFK